MVTNEYELVEIKNNRVETMDGNANNQSTGDANDRKLEFYNLIFKLLSASSYCHF